MAQISTIKSFWIEDFDKDGNLDIVAVGNSYAPEVKTGRLSGSLGLMLRGAGGGIFKIIAPSSSGLIAQGDVRRIVKIRGKKIFLLVSKHNDKFTKVQY